MSKCYVIFERPEGSKVWTLAHNRAGLVMQYSEKSNAAKAAVEVESRRAWCKGVPDKTPIKAHIAEIELPE